MLPVYNQVRSVIKNRAKYKSVFYRFITIYLDWRQAAIILYCICGEKTLNAPAFDTYKAIKALTRAGAAEPLAEGSGCHFRHRAWCSGDQG